jgi:hypothetical protein
MVGLLTMHRQRPRGSMPRVLVCLQRWMGAEIEVGCERNRQKTLAPLGMPPQRMGGKSAVASTRLVAWGAREVQMLESESDRLIEMLESEFDCRIEIVKKVGCEVEPAASHPWMPPLVDVGRTSSNTRPAGRMVGRPRLAASRQRFDRLAARVRVTADATTAGTRWWETRW